MNTPAPLRLQDLAKGQEVVFVEMDGTDAWSWAVEFQEFQTLPEGNLMNATFYDPEGGSPFVVWSHDGVRVADPELGGAVFTLRRA